MTAFIVRSTDATEPEAYTRFPEQPIDARQPGRHVRPLRPPRAAQLSLTRSCCASAVARWATMCGVHGAFEDEDEDAVPWEAAA